MYGEEELSLVKKISANMSGLISIDVGANLGAYTYFLSKNSKIVLSFEPLEILNDYWEKII